MLYKKDKICIRTFFFIILAAFCLNLGVRAAHREILQQGIAQEILRFHVVANSDSEEDQRVKYLVRDKILAWMKEKRNKEDAGQTDRFVQKEEAAVFFKEHLSEMEAEADRVLRENGMDYQAKAELAQIYFSERVYGEYTFPAGWYEALRIRLGKADGHNWWCVLYPKLSFSNCIRGVKKDGNPAGDLKEVLTAQEYESLFCEPKKWKIAFRWF